jgi:hypothetical protein
MSSVVLINIDVVEARASSHYSVHSSIVAVVLLENAV